MNRLIKFLNFKPNNQFIIGSYEDDNIKYKSDIDINEIIKIRSNIKDKYLDKIYNYFKNLYLNQDKYNYIITDFKAGEFNKLKLKWTEDEILNNKKEFETIKGSKFISLQEALLTKSTIKIDIIYIDKKLILNEITKNYFFIFSNFDTTPNEEEFEAALRDDMEDQYKTDYIKYLKRLYKIKQYKKEDFEEELKILNSEIGKLNYYIDHIKLIDKIEDLEIENKDKIIKKNLKYINDGIKDTLDFKFKITLKNKDKKFNQVKKQIKNLLI